MTLSELNARMSHDEYLRWRAFYEWEAWMADERARQARLREAR